MSKYKKSFIEFINGEEIASSNLTGYCSKDELYSWTTELLKYYPTCDLSDKNVLTITSSGDHILHAVLQGATKIDSIDINSFSKNLSSLKIAMIKKYKRRKFIRNYNKFTTTINDKVLEKILNDISIYLTNDELYFWNLYIRYIQENTKFKHFKGKTIFIDDEDCNYKNNDYLKKQNYYNLKEKLKDVEINYYDADIIHVGKVLMNKKYDTIMLGNLLSRIGAGRFICDEALKQAIKIVISLLNDEGLIYSYFYYSSYVLHDIFKETVSEFDDIDIEMKTIKVQNQKRKIFKNHDEVLILKKKDNKLKSKKA